MSSDGMEVMMGNASEIFMQEQQAKFEFSRAAAHLRSYFSNSESPQFFTAFDATTEAALRFGTCELRMRRAERLDALDLAGPEVKRLKSTAISNNKRGLTALAGVRPFVEGLAATKSSPEQLALWRKNSPALRAEWLEQVSQVNVSAENARHLVRIMNECCEAVDRDGAAGLGRHLSATLAELEKQRRAPGRGTQEASFPWWKIVFAAVILGLYIGALIDLLINRRPWYDLYAAALLTTIMMVMVVLGC